MSVILHKLRGDDLSDWDIKSLADIDEAWYWYEQGNYDGMGQMLARKGDLWDLHDMGHCSCYGPTENFSFNGRTLREVYENRSEGYVVETTELFNAVGYTP